MPTYEIRGTEWKHCSALPKERTATTTSLSVKRRKLFLWFISSWILCSAVTLPTHSTAGCCFSHKHHTHPLPSVSQSWRNPLTTTGFQTFNLDILDEWIRAAKKHKRRRSSRAVLLFYFIHSRSFMWIYTFSGKRRRRRRTDMQSFRDFRYSFGVLVK